MINFEFIEKIGPENDEICNIYAIYGCDSEGNPHFLVVGGMDDGAQAPVIDMSASDHKARIYNEEDSALEIAVDFGLVSDIKFFYEAESFDLTLNF